MHYSNAKPKITQGMFSHEPECLFSWGSERWWSEHGQAHPGRSAGERKGGRIEKVSYQRPEDGVTPSVTPHVPKPSNSCLLCAGHNIHDNLPIACSGKYCLIQSKQLNGISFSCAAIPKNPLSWSLWTAPLWLWLDQMASWNICCSTKPFCVYHL